MIEALEFWALAERKAPLMAIVHFFCDEGGKYQKDLVVSVSGVAAVRECLDAFHKDWQTLLRAYGLSELSMREAMKIERSVGTRLSSGQTLEKRQELLFPFADCINKYLEIGFIQGWSVVGYAKIPTEAKMLLGGANDPFQLAMIRGLMAIGQYARPDDHVNVICDDNLATAWDTYIHYREALKASEIDERFVGISFAKSFHYSPLQAADMVAFLGRKAAREKLYASPNDCKLLTDYLFTDPNPPAIMRWYTGFWGEQEMVNLANEILNAKTKSVSQVQQAIDSDSGGAPLGDQSQAGSGEENKKAEEI